MNISTTKEVIEDLIKINNDRIDGYTKAQKDIKEFDTLLEPVFAEMASHSKDNVSALIAMGTQLNADIDQGTTTSGKLHRLWMDVKATFTGGSKEAILESCEFGEDAILKVYSEAANEYADLPGELIDLMDEQQTKLKADHNKMKGMRDAAKAMS